ncbi:hypothetical protein TRFO_40035 [Tritrichomonas foetus]|uniref:KATNIP domain-containing protein n=1 Tax=Tritrichomonas foetus TaxID=1144522 RepID=A0A1J4J2P8_9EUKA|nr:hypothetical protein TRFO_40035 [Tritrichomonas foetus]|eukprot:OHS93694.1 hypothetical protein TRFO_40035 [Tritrichomonas foetus]
MKSINYKSSKRPLLNIRQFHQRKSNDSPNKLSRSQRFSYDPGSLKYTTRNISKVFSTLSPIITDLNPCSSFVLEPQKIVVKILSTWKNDGKTVECHGIDALSESLQTIPIISVDIHPKKYEGTSLKKLINRKLSDNDSWISEFTEGTCLIFTVFADVRIAYLRFFSLSTENAIKDVEIWKNGQLAFNGEISHELGPIVQLIQEKYKINRRFINIILERNLIPLDFDKYGLLPQLSTKTIKITLISNYSHEGNTLNSKFSLSGIQMKDGFKEQVCDNLIESIVLNDCTTSESQRSLQYNISPEFLRTTWCVTKSSIRNPHLIISLKERISISEIIITNSISSEISPEFGVSKLKIEFDDKSIFVGKIKQDLFRKDSRNAINYIFTNCVSPISVYILCLSHDHPL